MSPLCLFCGKLLVSNHQKKFCSTSCAASYNNKGVVHNKTGKNGSESKVSTRECIACGSTTKNKKHCSKECQSSGTIEDWLSGKVDGNRMWRRIRRYLIDQSGNKCSQCNWDKINPVTGNSPLEIDHIDGDWRNSRVENLRVLCPNCHALTPNHRALNKRPADRKVAGQRKQ